MIETVGKRTLRRSCLIAARLGDGAMQLNDDVREFFANYCRAFEAFDARALSAFFSYPVLVTRADPVRPQTMMASASDDVSAIAPLICI